jgi:hypothetical protein
VSITPISGFNGSVALSVGGLPAGATATFTPNPTTAGSTLRVQTAFGVRGSFTLTITGASGSVRRSATVSLTVAKH